MTLKEYLRSKLTDRGMTASELARRSGVTKQNIGRILNDTPHPISGALPKVSVETIDKLAKALGCPLDEARLAAGYAPKTITRRPETIPELVAALEQLGIEAPQPFGGYPKDDDGEGYREVVERIWLDIDMVTKRLTKGRDRPMIQNLELSEFDIEAETDRRKSG